MAAAEQIPRASERVHAVLRADILAGRLAPGDGVPSERALAERLTVHRQSVREALKRLEQAGLVRIHQGGATRVLDWRETAGLDLLTDLVHGGPGSPTPELVRAIIEMRASIGIDAARRCAVRADDALLAEVGRLAEAAADLIGKGDVTLEERYAAMWLTVVLGSENIAYRLAFNSLMRSLGDHPGVAELVRPGDACAIRAFAKAMLARDAAAVGAAAARLLGDGVP